MNPCSLSKATVYSIMTVSVCCLPSMVIFLGSFERGSTLSSFLISVIASPAIFSSAAWFSSQPTNAFALYIISLISFSSFQVSFLRFRLWWRYRCPLSPPLMLCRLCIHHTYRPFRGLPCQREEEGCPLLHL